MTKHIYLTVRGVTAEAELLESNAPKATAALWELLEEPIERTLISAKWSGDVGVLHPGEGPLREVADLENPVTSIYPGTIVMRPRGSEILIGYGVGEYRWAVGVDYLTRLAKVTTNRREFLAEVATTATSGPTGIVVGRHW
ncbi:MAG: DUF3830 family protein [Nostocoides sp.]